MKNFARAGWTVDAVEIDPVVIEVAQDYFGLQESEGTIYSMDGRQFLITNDKKYDIIVMDAFGSSSIPFHLVTRESFGLIASRLKADGVFAINLEANGWTDLIVRSLSATLKQNFEYVFVLPTYVPAGELGNIVLFAANYWLERPEDTERDFTDLKYISSLQYQRDRAWDNRFVPETVGVPVLTDDLNPVDLWSEEINLLARKDLHRYFEESGLSW